MNKKEILENIKKEALDNHVPIIEDEPLKLIEVLLKIKKPKRLRTGVYTTIAVIQLNDIHGLLDRNGLINLSNLKECLLPYENFIDKFV